MIHKSGQMTGGTSSSGQSGRKWDDNEAEGPPFCSQIHVLAI